MKEKETCMVCGAKWKRKIGVDQVPLCGTHANQLKRRRGVGLLGYLQHMTRPMIRVEFGFLVTDDRRATK